MYLLMERIKKWVYVPGFVVALLLAVGAYNDEYKEYDEYVHNVDKIAEGVTQRTQMSGGSIVHKCQSAALPIHQVLGSYPN